MTQKKKTKEAEKRSDFRSYVRAFWLLIFFGLLSIALMIGGAAFGAFGALPSFEEIENPVSNQASTVYSADGQIIGKYYRENRVHVEFDELSPIWSMHWWPQRTNATLNTAVSTSVHWHAQY